MPKLTKAQLLARIDELESELGLKGEKLAELEREVAALYVEQRPSRRERSSRDFTPTVTLTFKQRLALADQEARATGRCVRVL